MILAVSDASRRLVIRAPYVRPRDPTGILLRLGASYVLVRIRSIMHSIIDARRVRRIRYGILVLENARPSA